MFKLKKIMEIKKIFNKVGKKAGSKTEGVLSCLEYRDLDVYIAHCLEFDIVAQGDSPEEAKNNLADLIKAHIEFAIEKDVEDKSLFRLAPAKYWGILYNFRNRIARQQLLNQKEISARAILE